jgi:predicted NodU family carbamoyl transferase
MLILGLNMFHADASAAILQDGEIAFAIAEERLNRIKHYAGFPALAIQACLDAVGARISDVDHVAIGQDKDANLAKKIEYAVANPDKLLNFLQLRRRKQQMQNLRSLLGDLLLAIPALSNFRSITSSITSLTLPALSTVLPGIVLPASATTAPATSCPP